MLRKCVICKKGALQGKVLARKGQYKSKGGTGSKIARWSKRKFLPNLQKVIYWLKAHRKGSLSAPNASKRAISKKPPPGNLKPLFKKYIFGFQDH